MKLPSVAEIVLPGGYRWPQHSVPLGQWQAHLMKHPMGIGALRMVPAGVWNREGWDQLEPPAIDEQARAELAKSISDLKADKLSCGVLELRGKRLEPGEPAKRLQCYDCEAPLIAQCAKVVDQHGLPARYAAETERVVQSMVDGVSLAKPRLFQLLMAQLRPRGGTEAAAFWGGLAVLSVGLQKNQLFMRVSAADGLRVELTIPSNERLRWRTTYRDLKVAGIHGRISYLMDAPPAGTKLSLSEVYVVPRDWFNRHGT